MSELLAPRNTHDSAAWLTNEQKLDHRYFRECLILQHDARGIPSLFPTAFSAATGTPIAERVQKFENLRRGMVGFTKGSDPAGHVFFILGHRPNSDLTNPDNWLTKSNDVVSGRTGAVGVVALSFYFKNWSHKWLFGATWLNGYDFADFNAPPKPVHATLGANYEHAIEDIKKAIHAHRKAGDDKLVAGLKRDLARMQKRYENHQ
jgi:hypothetical protein